MNQTLDQPEVQPEVFSIEKLDAAQLPELQGLKEKQLQIVKENPFVAITDTATFEAAKKARTTLVSARTEIQNQDKTIASKIKKFREMVAGISEELISITKPHEEKQQEEVKRWEAIKEQERAEKQRLEDERIAKIKSAIEAIVNDAAAKIVTLSFERLESLKVDFEQNLYKTDTLQFEEFELDFNERLNFIKSQFAAKEKQLNELEAQRLENLRLEAERKKLEAERAELEKAVKEAEAKAEADRKALQEAQAKEEARIAKEKSDYEAKMEAERKAIADEQKAAQNKIDADRKALEDEKNRIAQEESDKKAKEEADRLAAEKAEADRIQAENEAARLEALKPEKEKAVQFLNALSLFNVDANDLPVITDLQISELIQTFVQKVESQRNDLIILINNL